MMFLSMKEIKRANWPAHLSAEQRAICGLFKRALIDQAKGSFKLRTKEEISADRGYPLPNGSKWIAEDKRAAFYYLSKMIDVYTGDPIAFGSASLDHIVPRYVFFVSADYLCHIDKPAHADAIMRAMNHSTNLVVCSHESNKNKDLQFWNSVLRGDYSGNLTFLQQNEGSIDRLSRFRITDADLKVPRTLFRTCIGKYAGVKGSTKIGSVTYSQRKLRAYRDFFGGSNA